jgi:hypothetical protein
MAGSAIDAVEASENYYHVRYRDPDGFEQIRTPDWAADAAGSVVAGAEVRTGDERGDDDWVVQSVLVPRDAVAGESEAREAAQRVVEKIES